MAYDRTKVVGTGASEPDAKELARMQDEIVRKLKSVTPDQIAEFRGSSLETAGDEAKAAWTKTVWSK